MVANDCEFGLQASCFTRALETAFRVGREVRAGSVWINEASRFRLDNYPYGGLGKSGSGREGIRYAMEEYTTWKCLGIRLPGKNLRVNPRWLRSEEAREGKDGMHSG